MKNKFNIGILVVTLILIVSGNIFAQKGVDKAHELMNRYEYTQAIEQFQKYFVLNPPSTQNLRDISFCYLEINMPQEAVKWLEKLSQKNDVQAHDILIYAKTLKTIGKYEEANEQYKRIAAQWTEYKELAENEVAAINKSIEWTNNPEHYSVENVEAFNSSGSEFGLILFDQKYIITSDRKSKSFYKNEELQSWTGDPYYKMFYIENKDEAKAKLIDNINGEFHNGPGSYDKNYQVLYFTRTKAVKNRQKPQYIDPTSWFNPPVRDLYTNRLEVYISEFKNDKWSEPKAFEYNNSDEYSVGHPAISKDGKILYFSSDMPGGMGESDIYFCERNDDGSWSKPQNAGSKINTAGKEVFPTISVDGKLHFSSDGLPGMGGLDIFVAEGSKNNWSNVENLKCPINSSKDDFSILYTEPEKVAFFASNRDGGKGGDDIYQLSYVPPANLILAVKTYEKFDGNVLPLKNVNVLISNSNGDESFAIKTNNDAIEYVKVTCNQHYDLKAQLDGYFAQTGEVQTQCKTYNDTVYVDLILERIIINKPIVLKNIYYDFDKWNIRPDAAVELDKLVKIMLDNPQIIVELGSHTDSRGSYKYNETLSQRRAESAVEYIISKGIDADRITAKGYGESQLVNNCSDGVNCSEEDHQLNRRTEFKVTGYKSGIVMYEP